MDIAVKTYYELMQTSDKPASNPNKNINTLSLSYLSVFSAITLLSTDSEYKEIIAKLLMKINVNLN